MGANVWEWLALWAGFVNTTLYTVFYAAGASASYFLGQLVLSSSNAWSWTHHSFEKLTEWSTRTINAFQSYTAAAVRPMAVALSNALIRLQSVVTNALPATINAIGGEVAAALQQIRATTNDLYVGLASLPDALISARSFAAAAFQQVEQVVFDVETRARAAFDVAVSKLNTVIDWVNATHHESGVFRSLPFSWSLFAFLDDVWLYLLACIASNSDLAEMNAYAAANPIPTAAQVFERATTGKYTAGVAAETAAALAKLGR